MSAQRIVGSILMLLVLGWHGFAQKPAFEVATVRLNKSGNSGEGVGPRGDRLSATNATLRTLLVYAFRPPSGFLLNAQIVGGPDWMTTDHFDLEAKQEGDVPLPPGSPQIRTMLQALLEDRFQLKAHHEQRDLPVYNLVLTKRGPKPSDDQTPPDPQRATIFFRAASEQSPPQARGSMAIIQGRSTTTLVGSAITISQLVALLQGSSDRIVVNKTDFDKLIDVRLEFNQTLAVLRNEGTLQAPPEAAISLFTAMEDAGLKLERAKAPMDVLVVDSAQRPSEN